MQLRYWQALNAHLKVHAPGIRPRTPKPRHWTHYSIGRSRFALSARVIRRAHRIGAGLFIRGEDAKTAFALLREQSEDIEKIIGCPLSWEESPDHASCRITLYKNDVDPADEADWPRQHAWLTDALLRLDKAFRQRVRALDIADEREGLETAE